MITRILTFIIIGLIPVFALQQCQVKSLSSLLDDTKGKLARSQTDLDAAVRTGNENVKAINGLRNEITLRDRLAAEQVKRAGNMARELGEARKQLQEKADNDKTLRDYLDSNIHHSVAEWLWVGSSDPGGSKEGNSIVAAAGQPDAGDTKTYLPVTHETGWEWARETDKALDSCNADKAALREWVAANSKNTYSQKLK